MSDRLFLCSYSCPVHLVIRHAAMSNSVLTMCREAMSTNKIWVPCSQAGFLLTLAIPDGDTCYDDKADIVELNGLQESTEFLLYPDRPPSSNLTSFLRLINVSGV